MTGRAAWVAILGAMLASPAVAEDAAPAAVPNDVIVTADRQEQAARRIALPVDVLTGDAIRDNGISRLDEIAQRVPGLVVQPTSVGNILFVRGVGNFTLTPNSDPAIAVNYDGVYLGRPTSTVGLFYDLARVEVVKGPQGLLYGRNATGGAINVLPAPPELGKTSGYADLAIGNYDAVSAEAALNLPLGRDVALRVSGNLVGHSGYLSDGTADQRSKAGRVQVKARLSPRLTVRIAGDMDHEGGLAQGIRYRDRWVFNPITQVFDVGPSGVGPREGVYSAASQAFRQTVAAGTAGRRLDALAPTPFQDNLFYGANAEIAWDTGIGALTVLPAWRRASLDFLSSASGFPIREREQDEQFSAEARLASRIGAFDTLLGGYFYDERIHNRTALSTGATGSYLDSRYHTRSFAPFARVTAHVTPRLRLIGGVRYTTDDKHFTGTTVSPTIFCRVAITGCPTVPLIPLVDSPADLPFALPAPGGPPLPIGTTGAVVARADRADDTSLTGKRATWRAAVEQDVGREALLYASVETGYRSGGFSPAAGFETYRPEYLTAYTAGAKALLLGGRVDVAVEGFWWDYRDQQVSHVGIDLSGRVANITQNLGRSRMAGADMSVTARPWTGASLSGQVQYLDAVARSFAYQQPLRSGRPYTGCKVSLSASPGFYDIDCSGLPAFNAPRWTIALAASQAVTVRGSQLRFALDGQYQSSRYVGFQYQPAQRVGPSVVGNALVELAPKGQRWTIAAYVRNLGDARTALYVQTHPTASLATEILSAPRTFGVRVGVTL